jgi:hypothetical protein
VKDVGDALKQGLLVSVWPAARGDLRHLGVEEGQAEPVPVPLSGAHPLKHLFGAMAL